MSGNPLLVDPVSDPPCISVDERTAARLMGVSTKTLQRWRVSGELKFFRGPGNLGKVLHRLEDLKQFALDQVAMTEQRERVRLRMRRICQSSALRARWSIMFRPRGD
jgi:hypothetical protein